MALLPLSALITEQTKDQIYKLGIAIAKTIGLPVDSWQPGDPTRSQFHIESELLEARDKLAAGFTRSGFPETAEGDWFKHHAKQFFNVDIPGASRAKTKVRLTNNGGGLYGTDIIKPNALTFKNNITGKTYRNTESGTLASGPGTTLDIEVEAEEAGSASSAGAGEITIMVTTLLGVTCSNATAAIGVDEQDKATSLKQCLDKLSMRSPNGPPGAWSFVARESTLTGSTAVTRAREFGSSETGAVTLYIAGPSGAVGEADRALVEAAIAKYALGLCITPTILSATNVIVPVTYELWVYSSVNRTSDQAKAEILTALQKAILAREIGGDIITGASTGKLYKSLLESTIQNVYGQTKAFRVSVTTPSGDTSLANNEVATLGLVTGTINFVKDP